MQRGFATSSHSLQKLSQLLSDWLHFTDVDSSICVNVLCAYKLNFFTVTILTFCEFSPEPSENSQSHAADGIGPVM